MVPGRLETEAIAAHGAYDDIYSQVQVELKLKHFPKSPCCTSESLTNELCQRSSKSSIFQTDGGYGLFSRLP